MNETYHYQSIAAMLHTQIIKLSFDGTVLEVYGEDAKAEDALEMGTELYAKVLEHKTTFIPDFFYEEDRYYALIFLNNGEKILVGPMNGSLEPSSYTGQQYQFKKNRFSYRMSEYGKKDFIQGVLLLFYLLTGKELSYDDYCEKTVLNDNVWNQANHEISKVVFHHQETEIPHNPYEHEARKLDCVRAGDFDLLKKCQNEAWFGEYGRVAKEPLRQAKNLAIITIVLASRAAIKGGLLPELGFSMADGYILTVEESNNVSQINAIAQRAEISFAQAVKELRDKKQKNPLVEQAKDYIFKHLHREIRVGEIADMLGIHRNYLSTLFHQEEGVSIQHYVCRQRIAQAENLLKYSHYKINEIANYLSFSSQSHFSYCFKRETQMTPREYRERFRKE